MSERAVAVGQRWQDKDRRSPNVVTVVEIVGSRVVIQRPSRKTWVRTARFVRAFRLVEDVPDASR